MCISNTISTPLQLGWPSSSDSVGCVLRGDRSRRSSSLLLPNMLPTISEDEAVDFDAGTPMSTGSGYSFVPTKQQQEQHIEAELDAEEMLLAAIDLRLQQLLQLRDQRQAAAAQRAARNAAPPAPAAPPALPVWYGACASPNNPTAAPVSAADASFKWSPAPQLMQQQVCQQLAVSDAAVLTAASKLQQIQAVQRMQLALQQELLELLTYGC